MTRVYQLSERTFLGIKQYLAKRPWEEVAGAMPEVMAAQPIEIAEEVEEKEDTSDPS